MACCSGKHLNMFLLMSLFLMGNIPLAFTFERGEEVPCDNYVLLDANKTYQWFYNDMEEKASATIVAHSFEPHVIIDSWCVHITTCVPTGSKPHADLMSAIRAHKSLSWMVLTCHDQPVIIKKPKEKETDCQPVSVGYFVLDPYIVPDSQPLDGSDIRLWNILACKLNLCGTFVKSRDPISAFLTIASGTVDLVIGQNAYLTQFFGNADFANAMGYKILYLTHGHPKQVEAIWTIIYPFDSKTWLVLILCTFFVSLVMVWINSYKYNKESPSFRITVIAVLGVISESFPTKWLNDKITPQVKLVVFVWLPMSFLLGCVYKSSLLSYLMAGELDDPPDTFEKVIDRDLIILLPTGTLADQLIGNSPFETFRLAYEHGKSKGGYYPWEEEIPPELQLAVVEGTAVDIKDANALVGNRHHARISKREHPVGYLLTGIMFKRNSPLRAKMQPILERLMDSGIYVHLKDMFLWRKAKPERDYERLKQDDNLVVLTWDHVGWTFLLVMCTGLALSCLSFIIEVVKVSFKNSQRRSEIDNFNTVYSDSKMNQKNDENNTVVKSLTPNLVI